MKVTPALIAAALTVCCAGSALAESTQWAGSIKCSWGSGSLKISIDKYGDIHGSVTNGAVKIGNKSGNRVDFETTNWAGNRAKYTGTIQGFSMSGTYTQSLSGETCNWSAKMVGVASDPPQSISKDAKDGALRALKKAAKKVVPKMSPEEKRRYQRERMDQGGSKGGGHRG